MLDKHDLELYSFSVYRGGYPRYAELLGKAGGGVAVRGSGGFKDPKDLTGSMKHFLEAIKPQLELAEKYDSYLAIENHGGHALLNYLDSIKAFTDLNDHPRLRIALAPYHIQRNKESVVEAIETYRCSSSPGPSRPDRCTSWSSLLLHPPRSCSRR